MKNIVITTTVIVDYDSRVIREVLFLSQKHKVFLFCCSQNLSRLQKMFNTNVEIFLLNNLAGYKKLYPINLEKRILAYEFENRKNFKFKVQKKLYQRFAFDIDPIAYLYIRVPHYRIIKSYIESKIDESIDVFYSNDLLPATIIHSIIEDNKIKAKHIVDLHEAFFTMSVFDYHYDLTEAIIKTIIQTSDLFVTVGKRLLLEYQNRYSINEGIYVYNSPHSQREKKHKLSNDFFNLVHVGIASKRRKLEKMIEVLKNLDNEYALHFHLVSNDEAQKNYVLELKAYAIKCGVDDRVFFHKPISPNRLTIMLQQYDIGIYYLDSERKDHNHYYATPNKLFEFVMGGLPVVVTKVGEMSEITESYGLGKTTNCNVVEFARQVEFVRENLKSLKVKVAQAQMELCAESQFKKIIDFVERDEYE